MDQSEVNSSPELVIGLSDVRFSYPDSRSSLVLDIPQWQITRGQQLFLHGPSGCGKTTLLNLLTGMLAPSCGEVRLLNEDLAKMSGRQRDRFRARHIGVVFQQFNLIPYLSVFDNIRLASHFGLRERTQNDSTITDLLEQLQMRNSLLTQRADSLSVGQQQRVAIARALINKPEILVVDEPTSALDGAASDAFMALLLAISRSNKSTLLFVSHDQRLASNFDEAISLQAINKVGVNVS